MPKLGEMATVITGLTLRDRTEELPGSSVRLLQLGDIDLSGSISYSSLVSVSPDLLSDRYLARVGDLVFRPRGAGLAVSLMTEDQGAVLVVSPLILIRPDRSCVDPGYLAWALRSPQAQRHFALHARGTSVIGVGKRDLETLDVALPNLEAQKKIASIVALQQVEDELLNRLRVARRRLVEAFLHGHIGAMPLELLKKG